MSRDADDIRDLIEEELPAIYSRIQRGDTKDECQDFSEAILRVLLEHGEDVIMVQARTEDGEPLHHFLMWRENGDEDPVIIDSTVTQLYSDSSPDSELKREYRNIFIGTREELREMILESDDRSFHDEHDNPARIFKEYWPRKVHLYEPDGLYRELDIPRPSKSDKEEFRDTWSMDAEFRVIQREKFAERASESARRREKPGRSERYTDRSRSSGDEWDRY